MPILRAGLVLGAGADWLPPLRRRALLREPGLELHGLRQRQLLPRVCRQLVRRPFYVCTPTVDAFIGCNSGKYAARQSSECTDCAMGKYDHDLTAETTCNLCWVGSFSDLGAPAPHGPHTLTSPARQQGTGQA